MIDMRELNSAEARGIMHGVAENIPNCICCPGAQQFPIKVRVACKSMMDEDGNFWLMYNKASYNMDINTGDQLELIYSEPGQAHLLTVYGMVEVAMDHIKLDKLWDLNASRNFEQGKKDPNIAMLKVIPNKAYYRDDQFGYFVELVQLQTAA